MLTGLWGVSGFLRLYPQPWWHWIPPLAPQSVSTQPTPVLSLVLISGAQVPALSPCQHWGCACQAGECRSPSALAATNWLLRSSQRLWSSPSVLADLPAGEGASQGAWTFPLSQPSPRGAGPIWISFLLLFFSFFLPGYMEIFLPLQQSEVFCQCSVDILWESFHM